MKQQQKKKKRTKKNPPKSTKSKTKSPKLPDPKQSGDQPKKSPHLSIWDQHENKKPYTPLLVRRLVGLGSSILRSISCIYNLHNGLIRGGMSEKEATY